MSSPGSFPLPHTHTPHPTHHKTKSVSCSQGARHGYGLVRFQDAEGVNPSHRGMPSRVAVRDTAVRRGRGGNGRQKKKKGSCSQGAWHGYGLVRFQDAEGVNPLHRGMPSRVAVRDTAGEAGECVPEDTPSRPRGHARRRRGQCGPE